MTAEVSDHVILTSIPTILTSVYIIDQGNQIRPLMYDSVKKYIEGICREMNLTYPNADRLTANIFPKVKKHNTITEIEELVIVCAADMIIEHYEYGSIATWILINRLHESTASDYYVVSDKTFLSQKQNRRNRTDRI